MSNFSRGFASFLLLLAVAACGSDTTLPGARTPVAERPVTNAPTTPPPGTTEARPDVPTAVDRPAVITPPPGGKIGRRVGRDITAAEPLRVMVIGDSLADGFGIFMPPVVRERGLPITVLNKGKTSTGLARADFYNWPGNFAALAAQSRPDVVVVHFGANDDKPVKRPDGTTVRYQTPEWDEAYRAEARKILDIAAQYGAVVYWLGPAPDRDTARNALLTKLNPLFRQEAGRAGAYFISLPAFTAGPNGEFVTTAGGTTIRAGDGSHFTVAGYRMVVDRILRAIQRDNPGIFDPPSVEVAALP